MLRNLILDILLMIAGVYALSAAETDKVLIIYLIIGLSITAIIFAILYWQRRDNGTRASFAADSMLAFLDSIRTVFSSPLAFIPFGIVGTTLFAYQIPARDGGATFGLIAGGFISLCMLFVATSLQNTKCPNCGLVNVAEFLSSQQTGVIEHEYTPYKKAYLNDNQGGLVGTADVPVQKKTSIPTFRVEKRCKQCGHEWANG